MCREATCRFADQRHCGRPILSRGAGTSLSTPRARLPDLDGCLYQKSVPEVCTGTSGAWERSSCCLKKSRSTGWSERSPAYQGHWDSEARESGSARRHTGACASRFWCDRVRHRLRLAENTTVRSSFWSWSPLLPAGQRMLRSMRLPSSRGAQWVGEPRPRCHQPTEAHRDRRRGRPKSGGGARPATTTKHARGLRSEKRPIPGVLGHPVGVVRG